MPLYKLKSNIKNSRNEKACEMWIVFSLSGSIWWQSPLPKEITLQISRNGAFLYQLNNH